MVKLKIYSNEKEKACFLIKGFWLTHNGWEQTDSETDNDLRNWTSFGHMFYFILYCDEYVGFIHLGSRGAGVDWLEDIYVKPEYQGKGIGTKAIFLIEETVKKYSVSMYIEAATRNEKAIRLYRKLGYNCLNTITVRKDFPEYKYDVIKTEKIYGMDFEIRKTKK